MRSKNTSRWESLIRNISKEIEEYKKSQEADYVDFRHDSAIQTSLTALTAPSVDPIKERHLNKNMYIPPFIVSADAINLIAEISAQVERYAIRLEQEDGLRLRKANRIKTIHSSLAIEGNTLSEDEVRDIIDGKNVVAPIRQIQEVKNAIQTYEMYPTLDAFKEKDLLRAHSVMMQALVDDAGRSTTSLSSSIRLLMVMAEWADCGSHLYWASYTRCLNICLWRTWFIVISNNTTKPLQQAVKLDSQVPLSTLC